MDFQTVREDMQVDLISLDIVIAVGDRIYQQFTNRFKGIFQSLLANQPHQAGDILKLLMYENFRLAQLLRERPLDFALDETV